MTQIVEDTEGKIRNKPISTALKTLLQKAGDEVGIQRIRITSGGQCAIGDCTRRTGSTRHDNGQAADLEISVDDHILEFTKASDLPTYVAFATACAKHGATGLGAGVEYMGSKTIHVGFGSKAIWGKGGRASEAPQWLIDAVWKGWENAVDASGTALFTVASVAELRSADVADGGSEQAEQSVVNDDCSADTEPS